MMHNSQILYTKLTPCAYFRNGMLFYALAAKKTCPINLNDLFVLHLNEFVRAEFPCCYVLMI